MDRRALLVGLAGLVAAPVLGRAAPAPGPTEASGITFGYWRPDTAVGSISFGRQSTVFLTSSDTRMMEPLLLVNQF